MIWRVAVGALLLAACSGGESERQLVVSAASSLTNAFGEVASAFEERHPGVSVVLNLGASSALREQILNGAPADVFASADEATMDAVINASAAAGSEVFAHNRLVIAVASGNPADVSGLEDLARTDLFVGLCAPSVPCGRLAALVLDTQGVVPAVDTYEPNVRSLVTKIGNGDLDMGLVYRSDVTGSSMVEGVGLPEDVDFANDYHIAVLDRAREPDLATAFVEFLLSPEGVAIVVANGLEAP
ncbi:MAG: molybdate ABC transporter substrate-binding protein [Acidimicrobiia bacterium]|nr:molybdate ABC transporter substrate-binding protein [Acidimicrobiia bacterium]